MAINKKFIRFRTLENYQREYNAGNILPKSICFCADAKAIYLNGEQFSINSLYNLEQLLESGTELASTDHLDEAVVKLYNNIKLIQEDIENVENEHTELAKIVKLLASEIADLETDLKEEIATNAEITSAALNDLNTNLKALKNQVEEQKIPTIIHDPVKTNVLTLSETAKAHNKEVLDTGYIGPVVIINNNNEKISTGTIFTAEKLNTDGASGVRIVYNCPYVEVIDQYTKKENYQYTQDWFGDIGNYHFNGILYYTTQSISLDSTERQNTAVDGNILYISNDYDPRKDAVNLATEGLVYNSTIQTEHGNVGDVVFVDKESEVITAVPKELIKDIDPERYEPIGIVVVPSNHNMYGTGECGIIALHCLSARTPDTGCFGDDAEDIAYGTGVLPDDLPKVEYWNSSGELSEGRNYKDDVWTTNDPNNNPVFPKENEEGDFSVDRRTRFVADPTLDYKNSGFRKYTSPYDAQLKSNLKYINNVYPHGDSIFSGKAYNKKILDTLVDETWKTASAITDTDFPLIKSAWRYHTIGTKQGDWYVPSVLEIGYLLNRTVTITNSAIELENLYNARFAGSPEPIWSVTACNNPSKAEFVYGQGRALQEARANAHFAIAFTTMKLSYTETLKDRLNRLEKRARIPEGGSDQQVLVWDYEGHAKWEDINKVLPLDTISYGVEWDINVADPHLTRIGNPELHKTLPIQSKLRGCVAKGSEIQYWLDPEDWNYRADRDRKYAGDSIISSVENSTDILIRKGMLELPKVVVGDSVMVSVMRPQENNPIEYIHTDLGRGVVIQEYIAGEYPSPSNPQGKPGQPMKVRLDKPIEEGTNTSGTLTFTLVSRLDGYDGTVKVYVPEFYIKSFINGDKRQVRISETRPNSTWTKQPACLVDAYKCTVLNTVPENMGYLSTLPVDSVVSIVNTSTYCRGGSNRTDYDQYLETDPFKTDLGKPISNKYKSRTVMRTNARKAGSELLSYDQYKNIFYWLYVVEYANFNCQEAFNADLTDEGYKQGGLGAGVTTINSAHWNYYNGYYSLTPCGYCNELGNGTGLKTMTVVTPTTSGGDPTQTYNFSVPRWRGFDNPFGDVWTNLDGIIIQGDAAGNPKTVYTTTDPNNYGDNEAAKNAMEIAGHEIHQDGYTKEFDLGDAAHIIPESVGGDTTKYKCDYHWAGSKNTSLRTLLVGGVADHGAGAGLGHFYSQDGVSQSQTHVGFRSVSLIS